MADEGNGGGGTIFFVMKSFDYDDVAQSIQKNIWATQARNEAQLNQAFHVSLA